MRKSKRESDDAYPRLPCPPFCVPGAAIQERPGLVRDGLDAYLAFGRGAVVVNAAFDRVGYLVLTEAARSSESFVREAIQRYRFKREILVLLELPTGAWLFRVTPRRPSLPHARLPHVDLCGGGPLSDAVSEPREAIQLVTRSAEARKAS